MADTAPAPKTPAADRLIPGPGRPALVAAVSAAVLVGLAGWLIGDRVQPGAGWAAWPAAGMALGVFLAGLVVMRVWAPRPMHAWAVAHLGAQAARFLAAIALVFVLLYSLPPVARGVGGVTFAVAYLAVLSAEIWATAGHFRRVLGESPERGAPADPTDSSDRRDPI